jgi:uncharacterized protein YndB with AHSA1/START domain
VFKAPRSLVFKAWSEPRHLAHWSGPHGFTSENSVMDLRPGGCYRACLRAPDGTEHWVRGEYREVVEPERLVFTHGWESDADVTTLVTVTFTDQGDDTLMTFRQAPFATAASRDGHRGGWTQSFERLEAHLSALR